MRTLTKLLLVVGLALTVSTSAQALITLTLTQVGGTCVSTGPHSCAAVAGDTLVLRINYTIATGDFVTAIAPGIVFNGSVQSFNAAGSTETGFAAWSGGAYSLSNLATGDIGINPLDSNQAFGWEKASTGAGGGTAPCVFGACTSMGTAAWVLSGNAGILVIGNVGLGGGTVVGDSTFMDIAGNPALVSLGTFTITPEPTTASLLGLGLLGLTVAGRRRRN